MLSWFYSTKSKEIAKELVIPCRKRNDVLLAKVQNAVGNTLDKEAAEEIIKGRKEVYIGRMIFQEY
jgi:hypothetical protein